MPRQRQCVPRLRGSRRLGLRIAHCELVSSLLLCRRQFQTLQCHLINATVRTQVSKLFLDRTFAARVAHVKMHAGRKSSHSHRVASVTAAFATPIPDSPATPNLASETKSHRALAAQSIGVPVPDSPSPRHTLPQRDGSELQSL